MARKARPGGGSRGPLKIVSQLRPVGEVMAGTAAAEVPALAPAKPEDVLIDPELDQLWDEVVPQLDAAGLVTVADGLAVEMCLRHAVMARQAFRQVDGEVMVDGEDGPKKNPAEVVFRQESDAFLKYAQQLGMTFVSRARTPAAKKDDADDNPFAPGAAAQ